MIHGKAAYYTRNSGKHPIPSFTSAKPPAAPGCPKAHLGWPREKGLGVASC